MVPQRDAPAGLSLARRNCHRRLERSRASRVRDVVERGPCRRRPRNRTESWRGSGCITGPAKLRDFLSGYQARDMACVSPRAMVLFRRGFGPLNLGHEPGRGKLPRLFSFCHESRQRVPAWLLTIRIRMATGKCRRSRSGPHRSECRSRRSWRGQRKCWCKHPSSK